MEHIRWYDKDPLMNNIFNFIEKLDTSTQVEIGQDIIQIVMNEIGNINPDSEINNITAQTFEYKRWYDKNPDLNFSFEIIKKLPEENQKEIMKKILETALVMYYGQDKE